MKFIVDRIEYSGTNKLDHATDVFARLEIDLTYETLLKRTSPIENNFHEIDDPYHFVEVEVNTLYVFYSFLLQSQVVNEQTFERINSSLVFKLIISSRKHRPTQTKRDGENQFFRRFEIR